MLEFDTTATQPVDFCGTTIMVGRGVLAPRAETELLAREAIALLPIGEIEPTVVDMCCGSGNLACAIAQNNAAARVWASDLTDETTLAATLNADRLGLSDRLLVVKGDMFAGLVGKLPIDGVDMIVANPPYISTGKLETESRDLLEDEPREAFDGGPYGISILQRLVNEAHPFLKPGGWLAFEFGLGQARQVELLFKRAKVYADLRFVNDALGNPRVAVARKV